MKSKTLLAALAILNVAIFATEAQVTVMTVTTNGLTEPYNVVVDVEVNGALGAAFDDNSIVSRVLQFGTEVGAGVRVAVDAGEGGLCRDV